MYEIVVGGLMFVSGIGWGLWLSEWQTRRDRAKKRLTNIEMSMPMNPDDAAGMMDLLADLLRKARATLAEAR